MSTRLTKVHGSLLAIALAGLCSAGCGGASRFALRPPVLKDSDDRPFARALPNDEESDYANALDVIILRPLSHAFLFEQAGEAHNVNSLDEVPDSTWFTNRRVAPADLERGPCPDAGPALPFTIKSSKTGGTTPGFFVKDARGQKYMVKIDGLAKTQPEITTAADAIGSRLYWAVGLNAPCNDVVHIDSKDLQINAKSTEVLNTGRKLPLTAARLAEVLAKGTYNAAGKLRVSASRFIPGEPAGTWRTEGTREDDPNDVIPHEDRRELRGERFLAAWINHWDSRGPNSFDSFMRAPDGGGGYIVHYFLDFGDSFGSTATRTRWAEPRLGFTTVSNVPQIATDAMTFGFVRRPWDEVRADPRYPNLGYLDVDHFDPMGFSPQTPLVRWARAQPSDLAWMARRIARLGVSHLRTAVRQGKLSDPAEEARLVEILMGRRDKILRASFSRVSPLSDLGMAGKDRLCASDLGIVTGLSQPGDVTYAVELRALAAIERSGAALEAARSPDGAQVCIDMPHFAPPDRPDDSPERYATLDISRAEGTFATALRAHFYDLGAERGYVLVGVER